MRGCRGGAVVVAIGVWWAATAAQAGILDAREAWDRHDYAAAFAACHGAAQAGDAVCQNFIGSLYGEGKGVRADPAEAARWYRRAAEQGNGPAATNLGRAYALGEGVPQDMDEAEKWLRQAVEQGVPDAKLILAIVLQGRGGNTREVVKLFRSAAAQGLPDAQYELGRAYETGHGVKVNDRLAARWYDAAAEHGDSGAQSRLAFLYEAGRGIEADPAEAYFWRKVALRDPKDPFRKEDEAALKRLAAMIPKADLAAAEAAARDWQPQPAEIVASRPRRHGASAHRKGKAEDEPVLRATGSGFLVSRAGDVVSNNHVVAQCREVRVTEGDKSVTASVLATDPERDLALVRLPHGAAQAAVFRGAPGVRPGESVVAVGFPLAGLLSSDPIVTTGIVNALAGPRDDRRMLQFSAPIQPGNSGGPLLDASGRIIGVVAATLNSLRVAKVTGVVPENVNFAIKGAEAQAFLEAHGVAIEVSDATKDLPTAAVAEQALRFTLRLECWR